jgi:hypothetical protein
MRTIPTDRAPLPSVLQRQVLTPRERRLQRQEWKRYESIVTHGIAWERRGWLAIGATLLIVAAAMGLVWMAGR